MDVRSQSKLRRCMCLFRLTEVENDVADVLWANEETKSPFKKNELFLMESKAKQSKANLQNCFLGWELQDGQIYFFVAMQFNFDLNVFRREDLMPHFHVCAWT